MRAARSGFTLIELLLVVVIILTTAGLATVAFSRSFQGGRIRMAAREIVALGRYARARAVLDGRTVLLRFDREGGIADTQIQAADGVDPDGVEDEAEAALLSGVLPFEPLGVWRRLPDGLRYTGIEVEDVDGAPDEEATVRFHPSGASDRVRIRIEDDAGRFAELHLDGAGGWRVEL